jgi:hypothetical protein
MAHLGIADVRGHLGQQRYLRLEQVADLDVAVTGERTDAHLVAVLADVGEILEAADVDDDARRGQAVLHQRDERVATGEELGVVAVLGEKRERFLGRPGTLVVERRGDHWAPPDTVAPLFCAAHCRTAFTMLW